MEPKMKVLPGFMATRGKRSNERKEVPRKEYPENVPPIGPGNGTPNRGNRTPNRGNQTPTRRKKVKESPKQRLEIYIISAQKLAKVTFLKRTKAYAVAWVDSHDTKLCTSLDTKGGRNPTWNSMFTFHVDTERLEEQHGINAGMTIEIYTKSWFKDKLMGSVRVLIADLVKGIAESRGKCMTYMVIRPSGKRKGLLNIGVRPERIYEDEVVLYKPSEPIQVDARG